MRKLIGFAVLFLGFAPMAQAQIQIGGSNRTARRIEERWIQAKICAEQSRTAYGFQECLRGRPLVSVMEGNLALLDDVSSVGSTDDSNSIVRGTVWGRGSSDRRVRQERRLPRTVISPVEGAITSAIIVGGAADSLRYGVVTGAATYVGLRAVDAILERRERSRMEKEELLRQEEAEARMREREEVSSHSPSVAVAEFELTNASSAAIEVFDGEKFLFRMRPGERRKVSSPQEQYRASALIPNKYGGISRGDLETSSTNSGWTFEEPAAVARR